jgi:hypothetical protein
MAVVELLSAGRNENLELSTVLDNDIIQIKVGSSVVHYGRLVATDYRESKAGRIYSVTSRLDSHMFGEPLSVHNVTLTGINADGRIDVQGGDVVFNPVFDGQIVGNRSSGLVDNIGDPAQVFTPSVSFSDWTLDRVIRYLCTKLNAGQAHVINPTLAELTTALGVSATAPLIRNLSIRFGSFLPEILNSILIPFGFGWKIDYANVFPKIVVYPRNASSVFFIDDEVSELRIKNDLASNAASTVKVIGSRQQVETTIELTPDWDRSKQTESFEKYRLGDAGWATDPELSNVFRRWTVGTYYPTDGGPSGSNYTSRANFNAAALQALAGTGEPFHLRRQFQPCISQNLDGRPFGKYNGCFIEYAIVPESGPLDWIPVEGGSTGAELKNGKSVEVLKDHLGVYFNGQFPPPLMHSIDIDNIKIRITATIETDSRITHETNEVFSQLDDGKLLVVDMPTEFPTRRRYNSQLAGRPDVSDGGLVDSSATIQAFAETVKLQQRRSTGGFAVLPGIQPVYQTRIGQAVAGINGVALYDPIVKSCEFNLQNQTTTLTFADPNV